MSLLKNKIQRTLINLIGFPLILFIVYKGGFLFNSFFFIVAVLSIKELNDLAKLKDYSINTLFLYVSTIFIFFSESLKNNIPIIYNIINDVNYWHIILFIFILIWEIFRFKRKPLVNVSLTIIGFVWIVIFLSKATFIREIAPGGYELVLCMFLSVWSCDSAAFYFGSRFGRKKILPQISPNKTWVGTIAGYVFSFLIVYLFVYLKLFNEISYSFVFMDIFILATIFGVLGQMGDFFESMFKREVNVKDSGTLLQGHGGVLDRFDSLLFVIPSLYVYVQYFILN